MNTCLIIGYPIKTSLSPLIHNTGYRKLKLDKDYIFTSLEVKRENLEKVMQGVRNLGIKGVSVTMPLKVDVIKYLDEIDSDAAKIGAVNTIVNKGGRLIGFNTDYMGAMHALENRTKVINKKVAVIGAGGAARGIIYGLVKKGAKVVIFNRSLNKAKNLAEEFNCTYKPLSEIADVQGFDIIINTTSVGMNEDKSLVDKNLLNKFQVIFDTIYSPKNTKLLKDAKLKKAKVVYGSEMFLYQAVEQFTIYTGHHAPINSMRRELERYL